MKTKTAILSSLFSAGLLLGIAPLAQADTYVTFQVDMTAQVQAGTFTNGVNTVYALGTFNNWGNSPYTGFQLTNNPSGANTNLYVGTYDDTLDTNSGAMQWKFTTSNLSFETTANGNHNRAVLLPATSGSSLVLPVEWFSDAGNYEVYPATFRVNMAQQIALGTFAPNTMTVEVQGDQLGWASGNTLTADPSILTTNQYGAVSSNVYVGTFAVGGSPGQINNFKYVIETGSSAIYESPNNVNGAGQDSNNRFTFVEANPPLPIVYFSDVPFAPVGTNTYVFSVDMTVPILTGALSNQQVTVRGDFNQWGLTYTNVCTNNPNASNTNIYSTAVTIVNGVGAMTQFKFLIGDNYEYDPSHTYLGNPSVVAGQPNREFTDLATTGTNVILPTVYFNDLPASAVLPVPTAVTFNVNMTGAVGTDAHVFDPNTDSVYINGMDTTNSPGNYSWASWVANPGPTDALSQFQMQENPIGSSNYTITITIPAGYPVKLSYKYSINGNDDEAGFNVNHVRYIRSTGSYTLPTDIFGPIGMITEQSFGNLAIGPMSGGNVPITWLGRPGVYLQMSTNLANGPWIDLPATDAQSATNYPVGAGANYFRLFNPF